MSPRRARRVMLATLLVLASAGAELHPADNPRLAPDLSFTDDSSSRFPIEGEHLEEADVGNGRATIALFGTAHCWNTNREAERSSRCF
jgi:hypothetical protein